MWRLLSLEKPSRNGDYLVKVIPEIDRIGVEETIVMRYYNGCFLSKDSKYNSGYKLIAWKNL